MVTKAKPPAYCGNCRYCRKHVVFGRMLSGTYRTFETHPMPAAKLAPSDAYAYSRGHDAFIDMVGVRALPAHVLAAYFCQEYRDAKLLAGIGIFGAIADDATLPTSTAAHTA